MHDFDSNSSSLRCFFCENIITTAKTENNETIDILDDYDYDFFKCPSCKKYVKIELLIHKEYEFICSKPTEEEIESHNLEEEEEEEEEMDVPGQIFMWE